MSPYLPDDEASSTTETSANFYQTTFGVILGYAAVRVG
jgi:hypothetical protein